MYIYFNKRVVFVSVRLVRDDIFSSSSYTRVQMTPFSTSNGKLFSLQQYTYIHIYRVVFQGHIRKFLGTRSNFTVKWASLVLYDVTNPVRGLLTCISL